MNDNEEVLMTLKILEGIHVGDEPEFPVLGTIWVDTKENKTWAWGSRNVHDGDQWFDINSKAYRVGQMQFPGEGRVKNTIEMTRTSLVRTEELSTTTALHEGSLAAKCAEDHLLRISGYDHNIKLGAATGRSGMVRISTRIIARTMADNVALNWDKTP